VFEEVSGDQGGTLDIVGPHGVATGDVGSGEQNHGHHPAQGMRNGIRNGVGSDDQAVDAFGQFADSFGSIIQTPGHDQDDALTRIRGHGLKAHDQLGVVGDRQVSQHQPVRLVPRGSGAPGSVGR